MKKSTKDVMTPSSKTSTAVTTPAVTRDLFAALDEMVKAAKTTTPEKAMLSMAAIAW